MVLISCLIPHVEENSSFWAFLAAQSWEAEAIWSNLLYLSIAGMISKFPKKRNSCSFRIFKVNGCGAICSCLPWWFWMTLQETQKVLVARSRKRVALLVSISFSTLHLVSAALADGIWWSFFWSGMTVPIYWHSLTVYFWLHTFGCLLGATSVSLY